jgi:CPA2 family monovalent cation:H+ antiporter-2
MSNIRLSGRTSFNVGLTLLGRGEFSIIVAKLAQTGALLPVIQPFAALYVVILATFAPLMAKESERIYSALSGPLQRRKKVQEDEPVVSDTNADEDVV